MNIQAEFAPPYLPNMRFKYHVFAGQSLTVVSNIPEMWAGTFPSLVMLHVARQVNGYSGMLAATVSREWSTTTRYPVIFQHTRNLGTERMTIDHTKTAPQAFALAFGSAKAPRIFEQLLWHYIHTIDDKLLLLFTERKFECVTEKKMAALTRRIIWMTIHQNENCLECSTPF